MEAYAKPIRALAEAMQWFVRATEVKALHALVETDLAKAALTLIAAQELQPANRAPFFVLEDAYARDDEGWGLRVDRMRAHHDARRKAVEKDGGELGALPPRPETGTPARDFIEQIEQLLATKLEWNEGLVVVLAPTRVDDEAGWEASVEQLVSAPRLADVRWVLVDLERATMGAWLDAMGTRAMRVVVAVDAAAAQAELGGMLDAMEAAPEGVSGPARTGAAWPRGVTPPPRPEYPVTNREELDRALAAAGVVVPEAARVGPALGLKVLRASQAMRQRRDADAVRFQREARDLCLAHGMMRDATVMELILGSFVAGMERRGEAIEVYRQAIARADEHGFAELSVQALMAMAALQLVDRRRDAACETYVAAAHKAAEADVKLLAIEGWRMAGQLRLDAGDHTGATTFWRRALALADEAPPAEAKASGAAETAAALAAVYRAQGMEAQARALDDKVTALTADAPPQATA